MRPYYRQKADTFYDIARLCLARFLAFGLYLDTGMKTVPVRIIRRMAVVTAVAMALVLAGGVQGGVAYAAGNGSQDNRGNLVLASLAVSLPSDRALPRLFGATEQRYSDISAFTKWTGVLERFRNDFVASLDQPHMRDWMLFLAGQKGKPRAEQIEAVNRYMNRIRFVPDDKNYGVNDHWATPMEFLVRGGDCEDYAFAKYMSLRALGFAQEEMRLAVVYDEEMQMPHAVLVVYDGYEALVLDNQSPEVRSSAAIARYKPIYSISQVAWYRH